FFGGLDCLTEMKSDPLVFVYFLDEAAKLGAKDSLEGNFFGGDDVDFQAARDERGSDLERDEAGADNDRVPGTGDAVDDCPAVTQGAQIENPIAARDVESNRRSAGGDQQATILTAGAVAQLDGFRFGVEADGFYSRQNLDVLGFVEVFGMQCEPFFGRISRQIILREIGPVVGRVGIRVYHGDRPTIRFATQHLRAGVAGGAGADDNHRLWSSDRKGLKKHALARPRRPHTVGLALQLSRIALSGDAHDVVL